MKETGKYLYGIMNSNTAFSFFVSKDFPKNEKSEICEVYAITYQDISAVVADSEIVDYTHMPKDVLARLLVNHQKVIEKIMGLKHSIIPVQLGTYLSDEDEVKNILYKKYGFIKDILIKVKDKVEIDIVATWNDFNSVIKEISEEAEIKQIKEKLLNNPHSITVDDQMKIGEMIKRALEKEQQKISEQIRQALKVLSYRCKPHELMDDKMVINRAFLIDINKHNDFEKIIDALNVEFNERLNFRCVGPLPAYSFYTLQIKKWQFEEIDWAKEKLGLLNEFATKEEIRKAYQSKAILFHPDKNPNAPGIERKFNDVIKAYKILSEYYQDAGCFFNKDEFKKNAVSVKIKE